MPTDDAPLLAEVRSADDDDDDAREDATARRVAPRRDGADARRGGAHGARAVVHAEPCIALRVASRRVRAGDDGRGGVVDAPRALDTFRF